MQCLVALKVLFGVFVGLLRTLHGGIHRFQVTFKGGLVDFGNNLPCGYN